jgi:hypothetical protein
MVIHNDTQKAAYAWQDQVIGWISEAAAEAAADEPKRLRSIVGVSVWIDRFCLTG